MIALLQVATIIASRGDVYLLGEAYAFGVVWSFFLKSLGVLVLRYQRHDQEYKFPFNIRIARRGDSPRARCHDAGAGLRGRRQFVLETNRHHLRRVVHLGCVRAVHDFRAGQSPQAALRNYRKGRSKNST